MRNFFALWVSCLRAYANTFLIGILSFLWVVAQVARSEEIHFSRQIRPILAKHCFACHGPSVAQNGLRVDLREMVVVGASGRAPVIVPTQPYASELFLRISASDDSRMPPLQTGPGLSFEEKHLIERWIASGSRWEDHWADQPLTQTASTDYTANARYIDEIVEIELKHHGLAPSLPEEKQRLLRRVYLDLVGLPPTLPELDAFLLDSQGGAYERVVETLLARPQFGEHWARWWLDQARYADSNGFEKDRMRSMWPYRDWVIDAFNMNMPFDQFTVEQLAGDLLPNASESQRVATGFHRNTMIHDEMGVHENEFRDKVLKDRVETTTAVWLAATIQCAQCHDHKHDPLSQKDYYALYAFFANTTDATTAPQQEAFQQTHFDSIPVMGTSWGKEATKLEDEIRLVRSKLLSVMANSNHGIESRSYLWMLAVPAGFAVSGVGWLIKKSCRRAFIF